MAGLSGCAIGQAGYLDDYGAVGGKWERGNPTSGRVGSPFSDAGTTVQTEQQSPSAAEEAPAAPSEAAPVAPAAKSNASDESVPARIPFEGVELSLSDG
ncbi:MAG: hypothetical protein D6753_03840 [Planctomycetota bacterium]|nr:MAG: hypothetical protein D6753_03840 [Planctomycetota bacterium]